MFYSFPIGKWFDCDREAFKRSLKKINKMERFCCVISFKKNFPTSKYQSRNESKHQNKQEKWNNLLKLGSIYFLDLFYERRISIGKSLTFENLVIRRVQGHLNIIIVQASTTSGIGENLQKEIHLYITQTTTYIHCLPDSNHTVFKHYTRKICIKLLYQNHS